MDKKGQVNWYLIISLILGIMILIIVVYWIFQEYFSGDDTSKELCRQSIILRSNAPEVDSRLGIFSLKNAFPIKCRNDVINITYTDKDKFEREFANAMAGCWYLTGEGKFKFFPTTWLTGDSSCLVCARIHVKNDPEVIKYYTDNPPDLKNSLNLKMSDGKTYLVYIQSVVSHPVTDNGIPVAEWRDYFDIVQDPGFLQKWPGGVYEPKTFNVARGDLYIVLSSVTGPNGPVGTFLLFMQGDDLGNLNDEMRTKFFGQKPCKSFETAIV